MTFRTECPSVDELVARKDEMGVNPDEAQYIYWLRAGVSNYLRSHSETKLRSDWPSVRDQILESHGY